MRGAPTTKDSEDGREALKTLGDFGYVPPVQWLRQGLGPWPQMCCCPTALPTSGGSVAPPYLVQHQVVLPIPQRGAIGAHQPHKGHGENPLAPVLGWRGHTGVRGDQGHGRQGEAMLGGRPGARDTHSRWRSDGGR